MKVEFVVAHSGNRPPHLYAFVGLLLVSIGVMLALVVGILVLDETLQQQVKRQARFLMIPGTPAYGLLPATATPTPTPTLQPPPTATPTATPTIVPAPPIRIRIPYIGVNSMVVDVIPAIYTTYSGETKARWDVPAYAVGHFLTSGNPGAGTNIVLSGHNNFLGEVFRDLYLLKEGKEIVLYSSEKEYRYVISEIRVVPYLRNIAKGEEILQGYMATADHEKVTIISCYPYLTNADRIVVVALPIDEVQP